MYKVRNEWFYIIWFRRNSMQWVTSQSMISLKMFECFKKNNENGKHSVFVENIHRLSRGHPMQCPARSNIFPKCKKKTSLFHSSFPIVIRKYAYVQLYEKLCVKKKIPTKSRIGVGHARAIFRFSLTLFTFELIINDWNMYSLRLDSSHSSFSKLDYLRLQQRQWPHLLYFRSTLAHPTSWLKWNDSVLIV